MASLDLEDELKALKKLESMKKTLKTNLGVIQLAPPKNFVAFGNVYELPRAVKETPSELPSEGMLQYLSGFFNGDGCVRSDMTALHIGQSVQGAEVLFLFQRFFGGTISVHAPETGLHCAALHWRVSGDKARKAAEMLNRTKLSKQRQLDPFYGGLLLAERSGELPRNSLKT